MNEKADHVIRNFSDGVRNVLGDSLSGIILYGSYARGDNHPGSDIDIMILTELSDKQIEKIEERIYDLAFDYEMDYGIDISAVIVNADHFNYWLGALPFYDNVKKEGVLLSG